MTKCRNRIMIAFAAVVMSLAMMPMITVDVFAGDAPATQYVDKKWENGQVVSTTKTQNDVAWMTSDHLEWHNGWWYTRDLEKLVISDRVSVDNGATANLILMDGKTIEFENGIHVGKGSTLNIYGQAQGTGKLIVGKSEADTAAIGGNAGESNGTINIYGGTIQVTGGSHSSNGGAGIGAGGSASNESSINIYGGTITSTGGANAAGIGGGARGGHGGAINIYGGNVTANGDSGAAGIGGGEGGSGTGTFIHGGEVHANGGSTSSDGGAGIGSGNKAGREGVVGGNVYVYGGKVYAKGGADAAGIGGGNEVNGGKVEINGVNGDDTYVEATSETLGAGIGGGQKGNGGTVVIQKGTVKATGGSDGAGIGGGDEGAGDTITINGGEVQATGGTDAAGIGGGEGGSAGEIIINGGKVQAKGGSTSADGGAGIGSGDKDGKNVNAGTIKINSGTVEVEGGPDAAGIGGGNGVPANKIEITGGTVKAKGGENGSGIGGGESGNSGSINITGGEVSALGGLNAAGIGGGKGGSGNVITIDGNKVTAIGEEHGAGIGGGEGGSAGNIKITGGDEIIATGGRLGAGIGCGQRGNDGIITIKAGKIKATAGSGAAGIGSGYSGYNGNPEGSVNTTIEGGDVTAIGGSDGGAGIGGACYVPSGKIQINGGTINATGGENGGAGIGAGSDIKKKTITTVDVTINGGNVTATPGTMRESPGRYPGVAIGTSGYAFYEGGERSITFFNGAINLNGGEVVAYAAKVKSGRLYEAHNVIGTADDDSLSEVTGNVNFNGAHVQMYTADPAKAVRATNICIEERDDIHQQVDYKTGAYGPVYTALADDRVSTLTSTEKYYVEVKPCEHKNADYTDDENDSTHTKNCKNCKLERATEAHIYGEPTWTWAGDNSTASARFTCACGHEATPDVTVESKKTADGSKRTYTAKVTLNDKEYTDTKTVDLPPVEVKSFPVYKDLTYTGEERPLGTPGVVEGGTLKYALGTDETTAPADSEFKDSVPVGKDAGTYYVWCKAFGDNDHRDSAAQSGTVKINKQTVSDPAIPAKFFIEGVTQKADVPVSDLYTVTKNEGGIDIGEYDVVLELTEADNYKWIDSDDATHTLKFNIVKAGTNIVTVSIAGWTWDKEGKDEKEPTVTATGGGATTTEITYARSPQGPWAEKEGVLDAGIWWVKASIPASEGHYPAGEDTARFEIAKAAPTVTPPTVKPLTYTGKAQALVTAGNVEGGTMYYAVTTEDGAPSEYAEDIPQATETGIYNVWYKVDGDKNHKDYEPHKVMARISADKADLQTVITEAKGYYNSIKDNESYGPAADKLSDAISEAEEIAADPNASQQRTNEVKESVKNATAKAKEDIEKADAVKAQINNLHDADVVSIADKEDIKKAKAAYDALSDDQKALIPEGMKEKLSNAEKALAEKEKEAKDVADKVAEELVEQKIASLPAKPGLNDRNAVKAARAAYNKLTPDQKALIPAETLKRLTDAEKAVEYAYKAAEAKVKTVKTVTVNVKTVSAKAINNAVNKAGGSNKYVTKIVLGKKVKKISKGAFKSYKKVKTLEVKTKKLKKKSVKNSLKGSKITKVKVNVGKKKTNKKYIKKYKKIFTKKNCGKKVKVK